MRAHTVKATLLLGFGVLLLTLMATALTGIKQIRSINSEMDAILHEHNHRIALMTTMRNVARERSLILQTMLLTSDPFERERLSLSLSDQGLIYINARKELMALVLNEEERGLLEEQHRISGNTSLEQNEVARQLIAGDDNEVYNQLINIIVPGQQQAMGLMDSYITMQHGYSEKIYAETGERLETTTLLLLVLLACGIALGVTIASYVTRRIQSELDARQRSERELQKSELRERIIRENIHDGIVITNSRGMIQSVNFAVSIIFGHDPDELIGTSIRSIIGNGETQETLDLLESFHASEDEPLFELGRELPGKRLDGSTIPVEVEVTQVRFDGEPHFILVIRDISARRSHEQLLRQHNEELEHKVMQRTQELTAEVEVRRMAEERLRYLASHDNLTGLPNRRLFMEQLDLSLRRARRQKTLVAVYFIDLDGFKAVNDSHGHDTGDKLLIDVAQRIIGVLRDSDVASRMGGDEFTIIASDLERLSDAERIADKLVRAISQPFRCGDVICHIGASIGISLSPDHGDEAEHLIQLADSAMYRVKNSGKRGYLIHATETVRHPLLVVSSE